ncbi:MAG: nuclear transport factor 2 family protein [Kibdelosporangium sp.]
MIRSAHSLVDQALELLLAHDMIGFAGLWAVDGVMEFPFAPADRPQRLTGRAAVEDYVRDYPAQLDVRAITSQTVYDTTDPAVVIVEFEVAGVVVPTSQPYQARYIAVITARDGEISNYRDYWNPQAAAELMGATA